MTVRRLVGRRGAKLPVIDNEPRAAERAARRRASRNVFRRYCVTCGRSVEGVTPPPGGTNRCDACGGTMLMELAKS